jgi:hypothetical protein
MEIIWRREVTQGQWGPFGVRLGRSRWGWWRCCKSRCWCWCLCVLCASVDCLESLEVNWSQLFNSRRWSAKHAFSGFALECRCLCAPEDRTRAILCLHLSKGKFVFNESCFYCDAELEVEERPQQERAALLQLTFIGSDAYKQGLHRRVPDWHQTRPLQLYCRVNYPCGTGAREQ